MKKIFSVFLAVMMLLSLLALFPTATAADEADEPVNLALGKGAKAYTASARNADDYQWKNLPGVTDGTTGDNWIYGVFGNFFVQIDLGMVYEISSINVTAYSPYNHAWSVYGSDDGENFAPIASVATVAHPAEGVTAEFAPTNARYVRVVADFYVTSGQFSFREVTVYGVEPDTPLDPVISLDKSASLYTATTANGTDYTLTSKPQVTDGNLSSDNWARGVFGEFYAQIDLDAVYTVSAVTVVGYANLKHGWSVYASEDGETYTYAGSVSSIVHPAEGITLRITPVNARYIRAVADFYPTSGQFSFREVTVYGRMPETAIYPITSGISVTLPDGSDGSALVNGVKTDWQNIIGAAGGYVTNDLGAVQPVTQIDVCAYETNSAYNVYGSADGSSWTFIGEKLLSETLAYDSTKGYQKSFACAGSYRYIRVQWAGSARNDGYLTIKEIDVWNGASEYSVTLTNNSVVYTNNNANDGNYGNYTFYKKPTGYVTLDLGENYDVRKLAVFTQSKDYGVSVEYSVDGASWQFFGAKAMKEDFNAAEGYVFEIEHATVRYLRILCTGSATGTFDLSEVVVYSPDAVPEIPEAYAYNGCVVDGHSVSFVGVISPDVIDAYDSVTLSINFTSANRTFATPSTFVASTIRGIAGTNETTAVSQGILYIDTTGYLTAATVSGVPSGTYAVELTVALNGQTTFTSETVALTVTVD